jgi:hypothetical protein
MAKKKKWISKAIKRPGALTRKAKAAGKSVSKFCRELPEGAATRTKRQCALAGTLRKMGRKKRK